MLAIFDRGREWVPKDRARLIERHSVLRKICGCLLWIPFEAHNGDCSTTAAAASNSGALTASAHQRPLTIASAAVWVQHVLDRSCVRQTIQDTPKPSDQLLRWTCALLELIKANT